MKTILITGAAGFIGTNLSKRLLKEENKIVGVDNFITGSRDNLKALNSDSNFSFIESSIESPSLKKKLSKYKFDEIYDLACPTGVPNLVTLAEEMFSACSAGTKNLLDIALANRAKFFFTSSSEVYGDPEIFPQTESYTGNVDPVGIRSPYEEGKRFSESLVIMFQRKFKLDTRIVRIFNTYGSHMSREDLRVVPKFIDQMLKGEDISLHGSGEQKRTFCYVDDLVNGFILVMEKGSRGEVYNIGSTEEITMVELAKLVIQISGKPSKIKLEKRLEYDHQARMPDLSKITALGWKQKVTLTEGLKKTFEWYRDPIHV